ncbi:hypothetical protein ES332_D09G045600v1 [Gossypium tomentosum]|uniref:DEAD-box RNA helicase Q domain-containing protein n=1 Tax=Gossypium tomentosum TaxID=34277 RepID=A0A5D2JDI4_GOSTO|nr:hypothetical protein ES332_D09G045600v1 [Gossypium tomentosum]
MEENYRMLKEINKKLRREIRYNGNYIPFPTMNPSFYWLIGIGEIKDNDAYEEELLDYEEEDEKAPDSASTKAVDSAKKGYVGIHSSGFRDFLLKPELLRSIVDSGFEHPSEGNHDIYIHHYDTITGLCNTSASLKLFWEWMCFAKQNLEWGKQLFLFYQLFSKLSLLLGKLLQLFYVTLEN